MHPALQLAAPDGLPYNLSHSHIYHSSEMGQDAWVDAVLGNRSGLFVVESGAHDGEQASNSLWLERARGWSCLLVEPNPITRQMLIAKHRQCHVLRAPHPRSYLRTHTCRSLTAHALSHLLPPL